MTRLIREFTSKSTKQDTQKPCNISSFDLPSCIDNIDPLLWKMVVLMTRSVKENQITSVPENMTHQRKMQCLYTLCVILFNTNRSCSVPLHLLLTDLVQSQGGSSELLHFLKSVGAIASLDTLQRHVQLYNEKKCKRGVLSELNMENFTVVSVNNINFLQRHAYVYCGDQSHSRHSTTVQAVQPTQSMVYDTEMENSSVLQRKQTTHPTPKNSPSTRSPALKNKIVEHEQPKKQQLTISNQPVLHLDEHFFSGFTHEANPYKPLFTIAKKGTHSLACPGGGCGCSSTPLALALALRHDKTRAERFSQRKLGVKSQWIQASSTISSVCLACSSY